MTDYTTPSAAPLDEIRTMTDAQARELHADLKAGNQLTPPPQLPTVSAEQLPQALDALQDTLSGQALAWGKLAPEGSAVAHYSNGLLYALSMLDSCQRLDPDPLHVLTMFNIWAVSFARDVLTESGMSEGQASDLIDALGDSPAQVREVLGDLGGAMPQGAFMAALAVFVAASDALTVGGDGEGLHRVFALHGSMLAGPDFIPPSRGEGMKA